MVAAPAFAFGTSKRMLFMGFGIEKYGEVSSDRPIAGRDHVFGFSADYHPVAIGNR